MKSKITFQAEIQEMALPDVRSWIGSARLDQIRSQDEAPYYVHLRFAHEGESGGRMLNQGNVKKQWKRDAIQKLADAFSPNNRNEPAPLFDMHDNKNDSSRPSVGRLEGSFTKVHNGCVTAEGVGYITDQETRNKIKDGRLDSCSIEAAIEFEEGSPGELVVKDIAVARGIALGKATSGMKPGFDGSGFIGEFQCFIAEQQESEATDMEPKDFTTAQIIEALKTGNHDLNTIRQLPQFAEHTATLMGKDAEKIKGLESQLDELTTGRDKLATQVTDLNSQVKGFEVEQKQMAYSTNLPEYVKKITEGQNTTEPNRKRIVAMLNDTGFVPTGETEEAQMESLTKQVTSIQKFLGPDDNSDGAGSQNNGDSNTTGTTNPPPAEGGQPNQAGALAGFAGVNMPDMPSIKDALVAGPASEDDGKGGTT